jgi:hypothetical protein
VEQRREIAEIRRTVTDGSGTPPAGAVQKSSGNFEPAKFPAVNPMRDLVGFPGPDFLTPQW